MFADVFVTLFTGFILFALMYMLQRAFFSIQKKSKIFLAEQLGAALCVALGGSLGALKIRTSRWVSDDNRTLVIIEFAVVLLILVACATAFCVSSFERKQITGRGIRLFLLSLMWIAVLSPLLYLLWKGT